MPYTGLIDFKESHVLIVLVILIVIPVLVGAYVYRDAGRRQMNAAFWTVVAFLAPFLTGFLIYLIVRVSHKVLKCPSCGAAVTDQYVVCPKCGEKLKSVCPHCGFPTEADWRVCPKCAVSIEERTC